MHDANNALNAKSAGKVGIATTQSYQYLAHYPVAGREAEPRSLA